MKKLIACLFCASLILSSVAGCSPSKKPGASKTSSVTSTGSKSNTSKSGSSTAGNSLGSSAISNSKSGSTATSVSAPIKKIVDPLKGVNLNGREIIVAVPSSMLFNTKKGTVSNYENAIADRTAKIQTALNCKIKIKLIEDPDKMYNAAFNDIMSGVKFADIIFTYAHKVTSYLTSELIAPINKVSSIDLSQPCWVSPTNEISNFKGNTYFVSSSANDLFEASNVVMFNKRLAKELGYTGQQDPYALVNSNQWTISKMRDMVKKATVEKDGKTGMTAADQWGLAQLDIGTAGMSAILMANGAKMILPNNGSFTYNMKAAKTIDSINLGYNFFIGDKTTFLANAPADTVNLFISGHALFYSGPLGYIKSISDMDDDFGLIPFPRGDAEANISSTVDWNCSVAMLPSNLKPDDAVAAGNVLQALAYLSLDTIKVNKQEYADRLFRDDESAKMLDKINSSLKMDAAQIFGSANVWPIHEGIYQVLYKTISENASPKTLVETYEKTATTALNELLAKIK